MSGDNKSVIEGPTSQYVKLNVGGTLHYTAIDTLTKHDSMLRAMFSSRMETPIDSEGWIVIDRCGKHFGKILNFLRDGSVPLPESPTEIAELLAEAKYYLIQELAESCESTLKRHDSAGVSVEPICRVPLITSAQEEQLLIKSSPKPVVKFFINLQRYENACTSASDRNLLKNLDLFDRVALRFSGRILFLKDVIISTGFCCWSFYKHGRRVAEIDCYSCDFGKGKVKYPEGQIYTEMMNLLM